MLRIRRIIPGIMTLSALVLVTLQLSIAQEPAAYVPKQDAPSAKPPAKKKTAKDANPKAKLTPDQVLAYQTLEMAESQARGLEAPMRSFSLLQIAGAFVTSDPAKARALLQDSFSASLAIQDDDTTKRSLQMDIFPLLLPISQSDVEERLTQAEPGARKQASEMIVASYIHKKQFDKAIDLIQQMTSWDEFPYGAAIPLLEVLPAEMNAEKLALFASAVASYRAHDHKQKAMFGSDISVMVARFGDSMPPKLALEAIDEILSQAKDSERKLSVSVGGSEGSASFNSYYEYQLFNMLPLLRRLDETRAEQLLKENTPLQTAVQRFPNGMDSIDKPAPGKDGGPPQGGPNFRIMAGGGANLSGQAAIRDEMLRRSDLILKMAETDPTQAVAQASALPVVLGPFQPSPRAEALEAIARLAMKKQPAGARTALAELRKSVKQMEPRDQVKYLSTAAKIYLEMDDKDKAEDVVDEGLGVAGKMLEVDLNPEDPNKALKAWWPSADAYRRFVEIETGMSHPAAAKLIQEIKDPDMRTTESIVFGRALLAIPTKTYRLVVTTKENNMNFNFADR